MEGYMVMRLLLYPQDVLIIGRLGGADAAVEM